MVKTLAKWVKESPEEHKAKIDWIKRHALRVLIKKAYPGALKLMGVAEKCDIKFGGLKLQNKTYKLGDVLEFEITFTSTSKKKQKIIVDYIVHFIKSNGSTSPKIFKLKSFDLGAGEKISIAKKHALKKITTMTFFKGQHEVSIQINGKIYGKAKWMFAP